MKNDWMNGKNISISRPVPKAFGIGSDNSSLCIPNVSFFVHHHTI
ncbi:MAG: hypothetical protein WC557_11785 [Ignavibacteriaceae bacterium]